MIFKAINHSQKYNGKLINFYTQEVLRSLELGFLSKHFYDTEYLH